MRHASYNRSGSQTAGVLGYDMFEDVVDVAQPCKGDQPGGGGVSAFNDLLGPISGTLDHLLYPGGPFGHASGHLRGVAEEVHGDRQLVLR